MYLPPYVCQCLHPLTCMIVTTLYPRCYSFWMPTCILRPLFILSMCSLALICRFNFCQHLQLTQLASPDCTYKVYHWPIYLECTDSYDMQLFYLNLYCYCGYLGMDSDCALSGAYTLLIYCTYYTMINLVV